MNLEIPGTLGIFGNLTFMGSLDIPSITSYDFWVSKVTATPRDSRYPKDPGEPSSGRSRVLRDYRDHRDLLDFNIPWVPGPQESQSPCGLPLGIQGFLGIAMV